MKIYFEASIERKKKNAIGFLVRLTFLHFSCLLIQGVVLEDEDLLALYSDNTLKERLIKW
jgi:hypothetical protein